ncbi:MAG: endonuclease/exonuclease/phosphatase family protein [Nitritalea sp.]
MRIFVCTLACSWLLLSAICASAQSYQLATYNLRFDNPGDKGNLWQDRLPHMLSLIRFHNMDLIGTQEGLANQLEDLREGLGFASIGVGRDDGQAKGEHSAILYNPEKFRLLENGDFWLSPTPEKPSVGWDAAMERICTWGQFETREGDRFWVFNVHFDHVGQQARLESTQLILQRISEQVAPGEAVVLMGDFNVSPDNAAYALLDQEERLHDTFKVSELPPHGPVGTFNAFNWDMLPDRRIDYIWVSEHFKTKRYGVLSDHYGKKYASDHFPVLVEVEFKR